MGGDYYIGPGTVLSAPSLFDPADVEPTHGRTRRTDPQPSVTGSVRAVARTQRRFIAAALLAGRPYLTADWCAENDHAHQSHRSVWSSRLGGLVADGFLEKGDPVPGPRQLVCSYRLTDAGREWARSLLAEGCAA